MSCELNDLTTEELNSLSLDIDRKTPIEILKIINEEDKKVALAVEKELPKIAKAIEKIINALKKGGRLIYVGAGTSGRLGILDAAECPPTFGTDKGQIIGIIAGGQQALIDAVEGVEDDKELGAKDLKKIEINRNDVILGITASGRTPYVIGAIEYAKQIGALTISLSCNTNSKISKISDISINVVVGPEVIAGSTRLKAGTAQKMVLNMITTVSMIEMGKVYKNLMVDLQPTNEKLLKRAIRIIMMATGVDYEESKELLIKSCYKPKVAIVMKKTGCNYEEAIEKLKKNNGFVYKTISL